MKVLYDISPMGDNLAQSASKAGIPRVVESVAYQLADRPDCHLELCSSLYLLSSLEYAHADERLKTVRFPHNKWKVSLNRTKKRAQRDFETETGLARQAARAKRKMMDFLLRLDADPLDRIEPASLQSADIYHSTFFPLSEQVRNAKGPQLFLTIYDLIPVLFPQFCVAGMGDWFRTSLLPSITEETWIVSISEATKRDLCEHLALDPARVFVTPLAADPDLFYPSHDASEQAQMRQKYGIHDAPYVLSLCTIEPRKNIDHVIRCFVRLMQSGQTPNLQLVLAGGKGWDYDHIFREIAGAEAFKGSIIVTGFVANEDLAALYSGALAFVFPSLYEGFGLPPLEAMQCGAPVVVSNTSSLPEVVGEAGIMLDPADADGLCQSLLALYESEDLRRELSGKSVARAGLFSWERCAKATVHAYKTALGS